MGKSIIGILTPPMGDAATTPLSNLANILNELSEELYIITSGNVQILKAKGYKPFYLSRLKYVLYSKTYDRVLHHFFTQVRYAIDLLKHRTVNTWVFFLDAENLVLPLLAAKMARKKVLLFMTASSSKSSELHKESFGYFTKLFRIMSYDFSDKIILYSEKLVDNWELSRYAKKVLIGHEHFLNFSLFSEQEKLLERSKEIGYVGRLSKEKGILSFIESIPLILERDSTVKFVIIGNGPLDKRMRHNVSKLNLDKSVNIEGWVSHDSLPTYLNHFKLIVLPSLTEGLPNVLLEAMACGTPVLATKVGAITDIIKNGETGFLLSSSDPEEIAQQVTSLLRKPLLLKSVSDTAYIWVRANFSQEKTLKAWQSILSDQLSNTKNT